jgi:hypothetical protein
VLAGDDEAVAPMLHRRDSGRSEPTRGAGASR